MEDKSVFEMNVGELMKSLMGGGASNESGICKMDNPVQPDSDVGEFGKTNVINVKETQEGGLEIETSEMAVKISAVIYDAIKSHIENKGE